MSEYWFLPFQDYREKMKKTSAPANSVKFETDAISAARTPRLNQYLMEAILLFERNEEGPENTKMHGDEITACNPRERVCCCQPWWTERHFQWQQFATRRAGPALLRSLPPSSSGAALESCPLSATHRCSWEKEQKGGWKTSVWQVIRNQSGGSQNSLRFRPLPESQSFVLPQAFLRTIPVNPSCFCTTNAPFHCSASPLLSSTSTSSLQSFKLCWQNSDTIHGVTWHCCTPSRTLVQGSQVRLQSSGLTSTCPTTAMKQSLPTTTS